jgi:energy-converting hydrogenase Eha subunit C
MVSGVVLMAGAAGWLLVSRGVDEVSSLSLR